MEHSKHAAKPSHTGTSYTNTESVTPDYEDTGCPKKDTVTVSEVIKPKRRQAEDISHRMSRLSSKYNKTDSTHGGQTVRPKKQQCSEIAELTSQLSKKLNPTNFTKEVHLRPSDPGYGTPQEGTKTAVRGRRAHESISKEIIEMAELIWEHGQMTGNILANNNQTFKYDEQGTMMVM